MSDECTGLLRSGQSGCKAPRLQEEPCFLGNVRKPSLLDREHGE